MTTIEKFEIKTDEGVLIVTHSRDDQGIDHYYGQEIFLYGGQGEIEDYTYEEFEELKMAQPLLDSWQIQELMFDITRQYGVTTYAAGTGLVPGMEISSTSGGKTSLLNDPQAHRIDEVSLMKARDLRRVGFDWKRYTTAEYIRECADPDRPEIFDPEDVTAISMLSWCRAYLQGK